MKKATKIFISIASAIAVGASSMIALAAAPANFKELVNNIFIDGLLRPIIPLLVGLAVVVFVYGVLLTVISDGGEKKEEGKQFMLWGIIGIFVMVSVWGLVAVLKSTFGLENTVPSIQMTVPNVNITH